MSKSDDDIYAKVEGDRLIEDADPLDRDAPPSLASPIKRTETTSAEPVISDNDWVLAHIRRPSGGTTCAFLQPGQIQTGDEPGTIRVRRPSEAIRRIGTERVAGNDLTVLSLQQVDNAFVNLCTERHDHAGGLVIDSDPFVGNRLDQSGEGNDPISDTGTWFVCRDATSRNRRSDHCYETYIPEEALQFRENNHYDRVPVLIENDQCITPEWNGPRGDFGVISTEVVRINADDIPASDERLREVEHNAQ